MAANSPSPNKPPMSVMIKVVPKKIPVHITPNSKNDAPVAEASNGD